MPSHFSLNLKTLCAKQTGIVLSIGIVHFNETQILKGLEIGLTLEEQAKRGRSINSERMHKWFHQMQDLQYRDYPFPQQLQLCPPRSAIKLLNNFILDNGTIPSRPDEAANFVWCRGVNFDWAILENLSHQFEVGLPFRYNAIKDQRQFCDDHVEHMPDKRRNAEYDAIYNALNIQSVVKITDKKLD